MKKINLFKLLSFALFLLIFSLNSSSCSSKVEKARDFSVGKSSVPQEADFAEKKDASFYDENPESAAQSSAEAQKNSVPEIGLSQKLIRNISLSMETKTFDETYIKIKNAVKEKEGYIQDEYLSTSNVRNNSYSVSLTIKIPKDLADPFLTAIEEGNHVLSKHDNVEDVTLAYSDTATRKKSLEIERDNLLEMLSKATLVEDMITIQTRLSEVTVDLETITSRLRVLDNQIDYTTIQIDLSDVSAFKPQVSLTFSERIKQGISDNLSSLGNGLKEILIILIIMIPYLLLVAVLLLIIFIAIKIQRKRKKKQLEKRNQENSNK